MQKINEYTLTQIAYTGSLKFHQQQHYIMTSWHFVQCNWECTGYIVNSKFDIKYGHLVAKRRTTYTQLYM